MVYKLLLKTVIFLSFSIVVLNSCKNDLDILAPYKESVAVYCLLDQNDTVNYVRVNRIFLGEGDANQMAQIKDSVYMKPGEATVYIEQWHNGILKKTIPFTETYEKPLTSGIFNTEQLLYRSTFKFKADSANKDFEYKLIVRKNASGKEYKASTTLVKEFNGSNGCSGITSNCFLASTFNLNIIPTANVVVKFSSTKYAKLYQLQMRFFYRDSFASGTVSPEKMVLIETGSQKTESPLNTEIVELTFPGTVYFNGIRNGVPDNDINIVQRLADSVQFLIYACGQELEFYRSINGVSGSFGQEKPIYTNISNGALGVFSSRYHYTLNKKMWDYSISIQTNVITLQSVNELMTGSTTCHLKFKGPKWPFNSGC